MVEPVLSHEGFVAFRGHRVWYGIAGEGEDTGKWPLLVLHGGPGLPHDYLEPLDGLAATGRRVVFYDQLGCGNSDRPSDPGFWDEEHFVRELTAVRETLGLDRMHLYGHSYGGIIALNYALARPAASTSLILANTFYSVAELVRGWHGLLADMPEDIAQIIRAYQETGATDDPEYQTKFQTHFFSRHVCRVPMPECVVRSFGKIGHEMYEVMHGPRWFKATGKYKDWDVRHRLDEIDLPTLVMCGRFDQCVPALSETLHQGIRGSRLHIFETASHLPYIEAPDEHTRILGEFLSTVERQAAERRESHGGAMLGSAE